MRRLWRYIGARVIPQAFFFLFFFADEGKFILLIRFMIQHVARYLFAHYVAWSTTPIRTLRPFLFVFFPQTCEDISVREKQKRPTGVNWSFVKEPPWTGEWNVESTTTEKEVKRLIKILSADVSIQLQASGKHLRDWADTAKPSPNVAVIFLFKCMQEAWHLWGAGSAAFLRDILENAKDCQYLKRLYQLETPLKKKKQQQ